LNKSRFENLETERPAQEREPKSDLSRFAATESPRQVFEGANVDAPDHIPQPANPIERFAASGDDGIALQSKDDGEQPFRRCPSCRRDSTRYEQVCKFCSTSLETPEALAFNEELWKRLRAEAQVEKVQLDAAHAKADQITQEQHDRLLEAQNKLMKDLETHYDGGASGSINWRWRLVLALVGTGFWAAAWKLPEWAPIVRVLLGGAGLVCWAFAVPAGFWRYANGFNSLNKR
jgi:hypothetical protein